MDVEKNAKKELRQLELKSLSLIDTKSQAYLVAQHILESLERELPLGEEIFPLCREELAAKTLQIFLEDGNEELIKKFWLTSIPYEDLQKYAKEHNLELRPLQCDPDVLELIESTGDVEHIYPALRKTYDWLRESLEKNQKNKE